MGTLLDTTVFIELERSRRNGPRDQNWLVAARKRLSSQLGTEEEVAIAAITASELLHGVHRADRANRLQREVFVERVLTAFPTVEFGLRSARAHARISADLAASGIDVGAHDRLIAATAVAEGWRVATANKRHFERIAGLQVIEVSLAA